MPNSLPALSALQVPVISRERVITQFTPSLLEKPRLEKDAGVETLRGLAIILMVMGHVIGDSIARGLHVEESSGYRYIYDMLEYLRMPLFTVISGFVYSMRPVSFASSRRFLDHKVERLFFPLLTIGTLQYLLQSIVPGANHHPGLAQLWTVYLYSYDQFWFLPAIFWLFLVMIPLDGFKLIDRCSSWLLCLLAAVLISLFGPDTDYLSIAGFHFLLPYFILGCGLYRFPQQIFRREVIALLMLVLVAGLSIQHVRHMQHLTFENNRINWLSLMVGLSGTVVLFALRKPVRSLAWLGSFSYGIFLMHVFPTAGSRIVLTRFGLHNRELLFISGLLAGLLVPIGLEFLIRKNSILQRYLLGERAKKKAPAAAESCRA